LILSAILHVIERPSKRWWLSGFIATALSVAFHPMVFYIAVLGMAAIAVLFVITSRISYKRVVLANAMIILGVFAAWLFLPTQLSSLSFGVSAVGSVAAVGDAGVRASTGFDSNIVPFSIRWNSFDVGLRPTNENYAGFGIALAALLSPLLVWRKSVVIFTLSAVALNVLATGTLTPFWELLPLSSSLEPRRFLFPGYLAIALALTATLSVLLRQLRLEPSAKVKIRAALGITVISALIVFDVLPMSNLLDPESRAVEKSWIEPAGEAADGGRMFWNAIKDFAPYYFVGREIGIETTGRYGSVDSATRQGFAETAVQELALLDTRAVLTDSGGFQPLVDEFVAEGFVRKYSRATQQILTSDRPSTRVMQPSREVGLLGVAANEYWSRIIPNSVRVTVNQEVPLAYLDSFSAMVVSGLTVENAAEIESTLIRYVEDGGLVFFGEPNRGDDDWFGVESSEYTVPEVLTIGSGVDAFDTKPFAIGANRFVGTIYENAGETVLQAVDAEGEIVPLIQKRVLGDGAVYWVCCHVGNHTVVNPGEDFALAHALRSYVEEEIGGYGDIWPESFGDMIEAPGPSQINFEYDIDEPQLVVISARPLRQRQVLLDDEIPLKVLNYGNVFAIVVPSGKHRVLVTTDSIPLRTNSLLIWIVGLGITVHLLRVLWSRLSSPPLPSTGVLPALRRRIFEPPFAQDFKVGAGVLRVCEPFIGERFDLRSVEGGYWRVEPAQRANSLAIVLVDLAASGDEQVAFDFDRLKLVDVRNAEFSTVPIDELHTTELLFPNLLHLISTKNPLLRSSLILNGGESVRGYLVFEFATEQEYPFVHDSFVMLN